MIVDMHAGFTTTLKKAYDDEDNANSGDDFGFSELNICDSDSRVKNVLGDLPTNMAENARAHKSLCDLPYGVTHELMRSMDTDKGWEALAAAADYTFDRIQQLALKQHQYDGSPTRSLLWELGCRNYKVTDLYDKLNDARRLREMKILEVYVKEGGQEGKGSSSEKKSPESSLFSSLPQLLSQMKVAADNKLYGNGESGFSASGSEINFNHPLAVDKSKAAVGKQKKYEDKIIPGTNGHSPKSSFGSTSNNDSWPFRQVPQGVGRSTSTPNPQIPLPVEFLKTSPSHPGYGFTSLPSCLQLSINSKSSDQKLCGGYMPSGSPESAGSSFNKSTLPVSSLNKIISTDLVQATVSPPLTPGPIDKSLSLTQPKDSLNSIDIAVPHKVCFKYREVYSATGGFSEDNFVGEGAFGKVYHGTIHHLDCAIKVLRAQSNDTQKLAEQIRNELSTLLKYQHENIVTLYGYAYSNTDLCLVYQYLVNGSLEDRLMRKGNTPPIPWERRLNIMVGTCKGLHFLQTLGSVPLIHGDIKSSNILLDQYLEAKLGDLGQAKYATSQSKESTGITHITVAESTTKLFGTKAYMAPEITSHCQQSKQSDVYALGVVFLELCSGQRAYDPNKNENKFLAEHFTVNIIEKHESQWKEEFQDKTLTNVPDDIFVHVLKLSSKCVHRTKKMRPDTGKLLNQLKEIYRQNREQDGEDATLPSISSSLQIDSRDSLTSHLSQVSGSEHSQGPLCSSPPSSQQTSIQQLQELRLQTFQSAKNAQSLLQNSQKDLHKQLPEPWTETRAPFDEEDSVSLRNHSKLGSPIESFPPNIPLPVPFRLQEAYDRQTEKNRIERLSGISQNEVPLEHGYLSDPQKLKKIEEFDQEHQNSEPSHHATLQLTNQPQDSFPQSDPKKLAMLYAFDKGNFDTSGPVTEVSGNLPCDPVKMEYLKKFDDGLYQKPQEKDYCSNTEETHAVKPSQSSYSQKEYFGQTQAEHRSSDVQIVGGLPFILAAGNAISQIYMPVCANQALNENHAAFIRASNAATGTELPESTPDHNSCRRPSDDSNADEPHTQIKPTTQIKPMKDKMNSFFSNYNMRKKNVNEDGDCDNDGEGEADTEVNCGNVTPSESEHYV